MKKIGCAALIVLLAGLIGITIAFAGGTLPEGVDTFLLDDNLFCVVWPDGSGDCYCSCEVNCETKTITPTVGPDPTDTPTKDPTPTIPPSDSTPTAVPEPTDKPKCNSGRGNGSEGDPDCDPGNSGGHNHGGD